MKLVIKRGQAEQKGLLGGSKGVTFSLHCRVLLNEEEHKLVQKYKADQYTLTELKYDTGVAVMIIGLMKGVTFNHSDIKTLLKNEQTVKEACEELKMLLQVMASFGGEEVIEY